MRAFLIACLAVVLLAGSGLVTLNMFQRTSAAAYSTDGARINPKWSWRNLLRRSAPAVSESMNVAALQGGPMSEQDECATETALAWLFVDFGDSPNDAPACR
jgi:hypothetical protein